jgi:hypothetical protein
MSIIDTTVDRKGHPIERARQQTLVIYAIPKPGATVAKDAVLQVWIEVDWDSVQCYNEGGHEGSSSSDWNCPDYNTPLDLDDPDRWAVIEAGKHTNNETAGSLCFSFPWLPAGRYKVALSTGVTGEVILAEQHTE